MSASDLAKYDNVSKEDLLKVRETNETESVSNTHTHTHTHTYTHTLTHAHSDTVSTHGPARAL